MDILFLWLNFVQIFYWLQSGTLLDTNFTHNSQIALSNKFVKVADYNNVVICPAMETTSTVTAEPREQCSPTNTDLKVNASVNLAQSSTTDMAGLGEQCAPTHVEPKLSGVNTGQSITTDMAGIREECTPTQAKSTVDASINLTQSSTTDTAEPREECAPTQVETEFSSEDTTCCIKTPVSILSINLKLFTLLSI